jgi:hypothetical protein
VRLVSLAGVGYRAATFHRFNGALRAQDDRR